MNTNIQEPNVFSHLPSRFPLALLTLLMFHSTLPCASAEPLESNPTLPTVTVSASRGTKLENMDISTTVLTREQVQQSPETNVEAIINKIPGIFTPQQPANQLHPTGQVLSIRGFGSSTNGLTLVLVNGVPINDPYFRTVDWGQVPKSSIERIEVIRGGGATSLWGNMAMGGVINIITHAPNTEEKTLEASVGSFNTATVGASLGFSPTPGVNVGLNYDGSKSDGYYQVPSQYRNPNMVSSTSHTNNVNAAVYVNPNKDSNYYIKLLAHETKEDGLTWNIARNTWTTYRLTAGGANKLSKHSQLNINGWYGKGSMETQNVSLQNAGNAYTFNINTPTVGSPYVSQTESADYKTLGGSAYVQTEWNQIKDIKAGLDVRSIEIDDPLNIYKITGYQGTLKAHATHQFEGLFIQGTYRAKETPLDITLGLREDFWQAKNGSISGVYNGSTIANTLPNQNFNRFNPRLGFKYFLTDDLTVRGAMYRNFSAPGLNQMYRSFISGAGYTTFNTSLVPQTNQGQEIGFDYTQAKYNISLNIFNNKLKNYIDYATVQSGCTNTCNTGVAGITSLRQYVNAGDATMRGFEILGNWNVTDTLQTSAGFTKTHAYLTQSYYSAASNGVIPDPTGQQVGQVPLWMATAGINWHVTPKVSLSLAAKKFPSYWNNTSHTQLNEAATLADIGATFKYDKNIELFGIAQNIGSKRYYDQGLGYTTTNGSTINTSTIPALGMPFNLTVGFRARF
ncbi:MAG: TonB-dependent receptor [Pseudomonadota bacterium]